MSRRVPWLPAEGTVLQAAKLMDLHDLGFLPICDAEARPIGVLTDRDITVRVLAQDRPAAQTRVDAVMSAPVQSVGAEQSIDEAGERMRKAGVWRLPVLDASRHLVGVVSLADVVVHASTENALAAARRVCSWDMREPDDLPPYTLTGPTAEQAPGDFGSGVPIPNTAQENPARLEAETVVAGGTNPLREFPST